MLPREDAIDYAKQGDAMSFDELARYYIGVLDELHDLLAKHELVLQDLSPVSPEGTYLDDALDGIRGILRDYDPRTQD